MARAQTHVSNERMQLVGSSSVFFVGFVAGLVYINSLDCKFCFDDLSAVVENADLRPDTPLSNLFRNDFWGTPMSQDGSHKSYRPLTVASFRFNYALDGLNARGYHALNILLHAGIAALLASLGALFYGSHSAAALVAGLSFALHPIHTEAVAGVVGRAELLSAVFFLLCFLSYRKSRQDEANSARYLIVSILLCIVSALCKEQGITVVALCCTYDIFIADKMDLFEWISFLKRPHLKPSIKRCFILTLSALAFMILRIKIMGAELPVFTSFDNPAAVASTPTRQLTYFYLLFVNAKLLLFPSSLCCDWTMQTIPLVESFFDVRNVGTGAFLLGLTYFLLFCSKGNHWEKKMTILGLAFIIFPFIPASNLFFPVGFVVAERILYVPSMGFSLLVGLGWKKLRGRFSPVLIDGLLVFTLLCHAAKTVSRNPDWHDDETLFTSAIRVNSRNAKLYSNLGHVFEDRKEYDEAERRFRHGVELQPDDVGGLINLGRVLKAMERFDESETYYQKAIDLMPKLKGEAADGLSSFRIPPSHINVYYNLANLIKRDPRRMDEAEKLYRKAIRMKPNFESAYMNLGDLLLKTNRMAEAEQAYQKAIDIRPSYADAHFNLGVVALSGNQAKKAERKFRDALAVDPNHVLSLLNLGLHLQETRQKEKLIEAERLYKRVLTVDGSNDKALFNLGIVAMDLGQGRAAENWFRRTLDIDPNHRSARFNLALVYSREGRHFEAIEEAEKVLEHHSRHTNSWQLLGDSHIAVKNYEKAITAYRGCLKVDNRHATCQHNIAIAFVELGQWKEAQKSFQQVLALDPQYPGIQQHLNVLQSKMKANASNK